MKSIVKTTITHCPIDLTLVLNPCDSNACVTFKLNKSMWEGGIVSGLPYFEHCIQLFQSLCGADSVEFVIEQNGNKLSTVPCVNGFKDMAMKVLPLLHVMKRLRRLCAHFGVDPKWNEGSFLRDLSHFNRIDAVVFDRQWKGFASGVVTTVISDKKSIAAIRKNKNKPAPFNLTSDLTYNLLGKEIPLGRVSHDFSSMIAKISQRNPIVIAEHGSSKSREYVVEFKPTPKSMLLMRLENPQRFDLSLPT